MLGSNDLHRVSDEQVRAEMNKTYLSLGNDSIGSQAEGGGQGR